MKPISVLIVDDSAFIRQMFTEILSSEPDIKVVGVATDPYDARAKIKELNPDVITLDIEMPKMDGLSFLEKIMALRPMPVLMVSSLTQNGADEAIRALEIGAFDYVGKPVHQQTRDTLNALKDELVSKVRAAVGAGLAKRSMARAARGAKAQPVPFNPAQTARYPVIAIGSSTGGVETLIDIFFHLPENAPPIVITQHMPPNFTRSFAARLNNLSLLNVSEAVENMPLRPGHAYIAPGNRHLQIMPGKDGLVCHLDDGPAVLNHRPSVNVLLESVAAAAGANAVGVILTGMGRDGADGLLRMRKLGARTIAQDEGSSIVYGMPKSAMQIGAAEMECALQDIPRQVLKLCEFLMDKGRLAREK